MSLVRRLALFALVFAVSPVAFADEAIKPEAKSHLDRGVELYEKQDYSAAIAEFSAGYAIDAKPAFLYARAQAERLAGKCDAAIEDYEKFLESGPAPEREAAARANLSKCKDEVAAATPAPSASAPEPTPPPPTPAPSVTSTPPSVTSPPPARAPVAESPPFYSDVLGDVLVGTGVVALGIGAYLIVSSNHLESEAKSSSESTYQAHLDRIDRAETERTLGFAVGGAGIALIGGGVLRFILHSRSSEPEMTGWATPRAGGLSLQGKF